MLHRVCARIGTEHGEACHRRIHGGGAGVNALRQCNGIGILHFFRRIPVCARMGIPQHRCNHKGNGGVSISGGTGGVLGTLVGAAIVGIINNLLNLRNVDSNWQKVVSGCIILVAVTIDILVKNSLRKK